jgi:hypothetical protein
MFGWPFTSNGEVKKLAEEAPLAGSETSKGGIFELEEREIQA